MEYVSTTTGIYNALFFYISTQITTHTHTHTLFEKVARLSSNTTRNLNFFPFSNLLNVLLLQL